MKNFPRSFATAFCAAALACAAACTKETPPVFEDPLGDLSFQDQARAAEKEFLDLAAANATKSCIRPVLRGEALPGNEMKDIIAAIEPVGGDDPCLASLSDARVLRLRNSYFEYRADSWDDFPPRKLANVRLFDGEMQTREPIDDVLVACASNFQNLRKAIAHEESCSPYLPGVRRIENRKPMYLKLATVAAISAIEMERSEGTRDAVELTLDTLRFGQDLHRGGTSLVEAMIANAGANHLLPVLEWILNRRKELGAPLLVQIDGELAALIATEPHPSSFLNADTLSTALYTALPMLFPQQWKPPGQDIGKPDEPAGFDPQLGRSTVITLHKFRLAYSLSCKPLDSDAACFSNMEKMSDFLCRRYVAEKGSPRCWLDWLRDPGRGRPDGDTPLLETCLGVAAFKNYVQKHGQTRFYLGALRLLARYRALAEETGACPGIDAFDRTDFADARKDPYSGKPFKVEEVGPGRFVVSSPEKLELGPYPNDAITVRIKCPYVD